MHETSRRSSSELRGAFTAFLAAAAAAAVVIGSGCSAPVRKYECAPAVAPPDLTATAIWSCNRDIMDRAAHGKSFSLREFDEAARFFERLTGISADSVRTDYGPLPGRGVKRNLVLWDEWFRDHGHRLYRDLELGTVELSAPEPEARS